MEVLQTGRNVVDDKTAKRDRKDKLLLYMSHKLKE